MFDPPQVFVRVLEYFLHDSRIKFIRYIKKHMPKAEYGKDLYILWIAEADICKIGRSTDTKRRLKEIQAYCP